MGIAPHKSIDPGQRRFRSVVGIQIDCCLPLGRPVEGNNGEGRTAFVATVIRLSQKTSSVFKLSSAGFGFRTGGLFFSPAIVSISSSSPLVVGSSQTPDASRRWTA